MDPNVPQTKYQRAKAGISMGRTIITGAYAIWLGVENQYQQKCVQQVCGKLYPDASSVAQQTCLTSDLTTVPETKTPYAACYGTMSKAKEIVGKAVPILLSTLDSATAALSLKEQLDAIKNDKKKLEAACVKVDPKRETSTKNALLANRYKKPTG